VVAYCQIDGHLSKLVAGGHCFEIGNFRGIECSGIEIEFRLACDGLCGVNESEVTVTTARVFISKGVTICNHRRHIRCMKHLGQLLESCWNE
jgi:hypothetical protein